MQCTNLQCIIGKACVHLWMWLLIIFLSLFLKKKQHQLKNVANIAQFACPVTEETYSEAGKGWLQSSVKTHFWKHSMPGLWNERKVCLQIICLVIFWHVTMLHLYPSTCVSLCLKFKMKTVNLGMIWSLSSRLNKVLKKNEAPFSILDKGNLWVTTNLKQCH